MSDAAIIGAACVFCFLNGLALGAWLVREWRADQVRTLTSHSEDLALKLKRATEDLAIADGEIYALDALLAKRERQIGEATRQTVAILNEIKAGLIGQGAK